MLVCEKLHANTIAQMNPKLSKRNHSCNRDCIFSCLLLDWKCAKVCLSVSVCLQKIIVLETCVQCISQVVKCAQIYFSKCVVFQIWNIVLHHLNSWLIRDWCVCLASYNHVSSKLLQVLNLCWIEGGLVIYEMLLFK